MAKTRIYYVHNGAYVQHTGSLDSCRAYIRNSRELFNVKGLTICIQRNGRYVPID